MKPFAIIAIVIATLLIVAILALLAWRRSDERDASAAWKALAHHGGGGASTFDPSMVAALPEPARRFFLYAIEPGTRLKTVAEIKMRGELGLGSKDKPNDVPMRGHQILAAPDGFVWKVKAGDGAMRMSGSDGYDGRRSWVRFWWMDLVPVVRAGGTQDHARAAFGRVVAEAVFWTPAALLPRSGVRWEALGQDAARATVVYNGMTQTVDVFVAEDGRPVKVIIPRWSDANPEKIYRTQPFGGYLFEFREFDGYRLPTRVEGGNFIGTEDYFPFYKAEVEELRFIGGD